MVCGRIYVLRLAHSCFTCVNSQITYVTPNHIVTEADISGIFSLFISISRRKLPIAYR